MKLGCPGIKYIRAKEVSKSWMERLKCRKNEKSVGKVQTLYLAVQFELNSAANNIYLVSEG